MLRHLHAYTHIHTYTYTHIYTPTLFPYTTPLPICDEELGIPPNVKAKEIMEKVKIGDKAALAATEYLKQKEKIGRAHV
jgi:hypothetical protein